MDYHFTSPLSRQAAPKREKNRAEGAYMGCKGASPCPPEAKSPGYRSKAAFNA